MGSRFLGALLSWFVVTLAILVGAGYAVTQIVVRTPRDPFRAGSFEFDLAPGWWCEREGGEYVCTPPDPPPRAAIAIIAIKERNDRDNLQQYEEHLSRPLTPAADSNRVSGPSRIRYVRRRMLGATQWVEALHIGSEVPNYDTYYLGTTTSHLGILVTMSVHKDHEAEYVKQLNEMMSTLHVYQH
jgi:hypothetical protein